MASFLFTPAPHQAAAKFIVGKAVVSKEVFDGLVPELRARAFTITGIESANVIERARNRIAALPAGASWDEVKADVVAGLSPWIEPGRAERRAEMLMRMHGFQAYAAGAHEVMMRQTDVFPFWQYVSAEDQKVRPTHAALDGKVLPADSPFWHDHTGPWEYGCRCQKVPLSTDDVADIEKADTEKIPEARRVISGDRLKRLEEGTLMAEENGVPRPIDVRAPRAKQGGSGYYWNPGDLHLTVDQLRDRYKDSPEAWDFFETWAKKTRIGERRGTVWAWLERTSPKPPAPSDGWPSLASLKEVRRLGGSTGAKLVAGPDGRRYVMKQGASADHLREEVLADELYRTLGLDVPAAKLYETPTGPVKLAEFVDGRELGDFLKTASPAQRDAVLEQVRRGFVADALLGNYDVAGLGLDNMLVDPAGKVWRIDNGGSLRFRAQGARKAVFGREVSELETLRNPSINAATARVFAGLTDDELKAQFTAVIEKRDAVLKAVPADLREVMSSRFDDLEKRLASLSGGWSPEFARQVREARILGKAHLGDEDKVEDLQVLWYQEKRGGQDFTVARFKLTPAGAAAVRAAHPELAGLKPFEDPFWNRLLPIIKHVGHHASDGSYNPTKLALLKSIAADLAGKDEGLKAHYAAAISELESAVKERRAPKLLAAYQPPPTKAEAGNGELTLASSPWAYVAKNKRRGYAEATGNQIYQVKSALAGKLAEGAEVRAILPDDGAVPFALRGLVEIAVPGAGGVDTLSAAARAAQALGVPIEAATPARRELTYLVRNLGVMHKELTPARRKAWQEIAADQTLDESGRVEKLRGWITKKLGIPLGDGRAFDPEGKENTFGYGWRHWDRWDLPREQVEREMAGFRLHHNFSGSLPDVIDSWLNGGAQITPTVERLRIGVPISSGLSPSTDLSTGGASYFFTRIKPESEARRSHGITFKIGNLSRLDAVSYRGDYFGDVRPAGENSHVKDPRTARGVTIEDWKANANNGSNETLFKNGFHLLEDVDAIVTANATERQRVLAIFAEHGYQKLPDGRDLTEVVITP